MRMKRMAALGVHIGAYEQELFVRHYVRAAKPFLDRPGRLKPHRLSGRDKPAQGFHAQDLTKVLGKVDAESGRVLKLAGGFRLALVLVPRQAQPDLEPFRLGPIFRELRRLIGRLNNGFVVHAPPSPEATAVSME